MPKTWKDLAQAAFKKQLEPKEKAPEPWTRRLESEQLERNVRGSVAASQASRKGKTSA